MVIVNMVVAYRARQISVQQISSSCIPECISFSKSLQPLSKSSTESLFVSYSMSRGNSSPS